MDKFLTFGRNNESILPGAHASTKVNISILLCSSLRIIENLTIPLESAEQWVDSLFKKRWRLIDLYRDNRSQLVVSHCDALRVHLLCFLFDLIYLELNRINWRGSTLGENCWLIFWFRFGVSINMGMPYL